MTFHPVMTVQEVLDRALEPARDVAHLSLDVQAVPAGGPPSGGPPGAALAAVDHLRRAERGAALQRVAEAVAGHLAAHALRAATRPRGGGAGRAHRHPSSPPTVEYRLTERGHGSVRSSMRCAPTREPASRARLVLGHASRIAPGAPRSTPAAGTAPGRLAGRPATSERRRRAGRRQSRDLLFLFSRIANSEAADDAAERDERCGDREPEVEAVQRRLFGGGRTACACNGGTPCTRASERQLLRRADRFARGRPVGCPPDGCRSTSVNDAAIAAPTAAVPSSPATRAIALLTPDAIPPSFRAGEHGRRQRRDGHRQTEREDQQRRQDFGEVFGLQPGQLEQRQPGGAISGPTPMKKRGPKRSASAPKRRESRNITSVTGSVARPLFSGV